MLIFLDTGVIRRLIHKGYGLYQEIKNALLKIVKEMQGELAICRQVLTELIGWAISKDPKIEYTISEKNVYTWLDDICKELTIKKLGSFDGARLEAEKSNLKKRKDRNGDVVMKEQILVETSAIQLVHFITFNGGIKNIARIITHKWVEGRPMTYKLT